MQLFSHRGKFIAGRAISIDLYDMRKFIEKLSEIEKLLNEWEGMRKEGTKDEYSGLQPTS